jgi:hypothetical protein
VKGNLSLQFGKNNDKIKKPGSPGLFSLSVNLNPVFKSAKMAKPVNRFPPG